jgi:hypothetical protein
MAKQKKWNNQGGSGWGDKNRKPKKSLPNIPAFEKLLESNTVSFRLPKLKKQSLDNFGDEIWTDWELFDDEIPEIEDYDLEIPDLDDDIQDLPNTLPPDIPINLLPQLVYEEYEITVKYRSDLGQLVLVILSGQAYGARNQINDPALDFAIVITSSQPIVITDGFPRDVNIIQLVNPTQDPIFSVYNWVLEKLSIATNNNGDGAEPIFSALNSRPAARLPSTSFLYGSTQYDLFYGSGVSPTQICLHATNYVLKYQFTENNGKFWSVLVANPPLALCRSLDNLLAFILMAPGSPISISPNNNPSNQFFTFRLFISTVRSVNTTILYSITGTADNDYFTVSGSGVVSAGLSFTDIEIRPLPNAAQISDKTIIVSLLPSSDYDIDTPSSQTVTLTAGLPIISIAVAPTSPLSMSGLVAPSQPFVFRISVDEPQPNDLLIRFDFAGTADQTRYNVTNPTVGGNFVIDAGDSYVDINVFPIADPLQLTDLTIVLDLLPDPLQYAIDISSAFVSLLIPVSHLTFRVKAPQPLNGTLSGLNPLISMSPILQIRGFNSSATQIDYNTPLRPVDNVLLAGYIEKIFQTSQYYRDYPTVEYFLRLRSNGFNINGADLIVSKKLIKDWSISTGYRFITLVVFHNEPGFDVNEANTGDTPTPNPSTRDYYNFINPIGVSLCETRFPTGLVDEVSIENQAFFTSTYPPEKLREIGDTNLRPIQVNLMSRRRQFATPEGGIDYGIASSLRTTYICGVEYDLLTDPDLISPRILPVAIDPTLGSIPPFPSLDLYVYSVIPNLPYEPLG